MDLIYRWDELKAIQDRINEIGQRTDLLVEKFGGAFGPYRDEYNALWDERHRLEPSAEMMRQRTIPEPGMPCTVIYYSDRHAATIIAVRGAKKKEVDVKDSHGFVHTYTHRRNGHWVQKGTTSKDWGTLLGIGYQEEYFDREF